MNSHEDRLLKKLELHFSSKSSALNASYNPSVSSFQPLAPVRTSFQASGRTLNNQSENRWNIPKYEPTVSNVYPRRSKLDSCPIDCYVTAPREIKPFQPKVNVVQKRESALTKPLKRQYLYDTNSKFQSELKANPEVKTTKKERNECIVLIQGSHKMVQARQPSLTKHGHSTSLGCLRDLPRGQQIEQVLQLNRNLNERIANLISHYQSKPRR